MEHNLHININAVTDYYWVGHDGQLDNSIMLDCQLSDRWLMHRFLAWQSGDLQFEN
jgi:hypothetical protein